MKLVVPAFLFGTAVGIAGTWFALSPATPAAKPAAATNAAPADQAEVSRLRNLVAAQKEEITTLRDQVSAMAASPAPEKKTSPEEDGLGGMIAKMMEGEGLAKMMETQAKNERRAKVERLSSRLKLTPEQRASLEAHLEAQDNARNAQMLAMQKSPLMKKMLSGQELTEEEEKELEKLGQGLGPGQGSSLKDWTKENLTPEQTAAYDRYQQERKAAQAEVSATHELNRINSIVDLSEEQKDRVFKHYSDQAMKSPFLEEIGDVVAGGVAVAGGEADVVAISPDPAHSPSDGPDDALKSILTPQQYETYKTHQEEERKAQEEMMKSLGLPNFGKPKGDKKK